ncbi:hypothetical protein PUR71_04305 [Streptomyces sp. SP17BM10]|uniref:hypothetical protein n=1 Tax=Streptomyces sp. SP17BM10 TaxID=3002530 RepID=UPI002E777903|nr:hypothetical protein [Streptomyces sp. SP17BM10]MEE1782153.1 hypothetical protein [Streptomyces sp. SP17BM10]
MGRTRYRLGAAATAYLAVAAAVGALAFALDRGPFRGRDGTEGREAAGYAAVFIAALAIGLPAARDATHEWQATRIPTVPVAASVDGCREIAGDTSSTYRCLYHWSFQGQPRQEERNARKIHPDGQVVTAALDPATGNLVDTAVARIVLRTIAAGTLACLDLFLLAVAPVAVPNWLRRVRSGPRPADRLPATPGG